MARKETAARFWFFAQIGEDFAAKGYTRIALDEHLRKTIVTRDCLCAHTHVANCEASLPASPLEAAIAAYAFNAANARAELALELAQEQHLADQLAKAAQANRDECDALRDANASLSVLNSVMAEAITVLHKERHEMIKGIQLREGKGY